MNRNKIIINISWSVAEELLTKFVELIISIILARLLFPEDYGLINLVQIFITISQIFVNCGLGSSIIQNKEATNEQISTIFYLNLFFGLLLYCVLFILAPYIASIRQTPELIPILRVLAIKIPISSIYSIQHSYIKKRMEFKKFFFSSLIGTVSAGVIGIVLAYKGYGVWALVFSSLVDQIMDSIFLFFSTKWLPKFSFNITNATGMIQYGAKILLSQLISRVYEQLRPLIIAIKYSVSDLAYNTKGQKFPYMIVELTTSTITKVMFPAFSSIQDDKEKLKKILLKSSQVSMYMLAPLMLGLAVVSNKLIPFLLTEKWIGCIQFVQVYCLIFLLSPITSLNAQIIDACGFSGISLKNNIITIFIELVTIIISIIVFDNAISIAIALLITRVFTFIIITKSTNKILGIKMYEQIKNVMPSIYLSILMSIFVYLLGKLFDDYFLSLVVQIFFGGAFYILVSFIGKLEPFTFISRYLSEHINNRNFHV